MENKNYKIYCLYHNKVFADYYKNQADFVTFVKMDRSDFIFRAKNHIYLANEPYFEPIGEAWAEYEFYYSLYKGYSKGLVELPEYLGFIQYDMTFTAKKNEKRMSVMDFLDNLEKNRELNENILVLFCPANFYIIDLEKGLGKVSQFYNLQSLFEQMRPEILSGRRICTGSAFFVHKNIFLKLMESISPIIEKGRLSALDNVARVQGEFGEKYTGVFLASANLHEIEFPVKHGLISSYQTPISRLKFKTKNKIGQIGKLLNKRFPKLYKLLKKL
jgi:hypothetical protein